MRTNVKNHSWCLTRDRGLVNDNISVVHLIVLKLARILTFSPPKNLDLFPKIGPGPIMCTLATNQGTGGWYRRYPNPGIAKKHHDTKPAKLKSELLIELKQ